MAIAQANWAAWVLSGFSFYDEIAALDPLDLDSLYTSAVLSKQQYFIDDHNLAADFKHWVKMPYWSPFEGVMLIHALDPSASALDVIHQHSRMDEQKKWPLFIALAQSTAIVERTQFDGLRATMMNQIEPVNFVKKVISLGLDVHPDLLAELENQGKWPPIEEGKLPSNEKLESEIEKRNRLRLIGFLIQLLRTDKAKKFASDDQLKDRLVELDEGQHGLSKRNLDAIFSAAKKELPSSRSQS